MPLQTDFHEVRFPTNIAIGSSGGPERHTEIVTLGSGKEKRNQRWSQSRRRYEAGYGIKDLNGVHEVIAFYEARRGPLYGFRYRDPLDYKSCLPLAIPSHTDVQLGTGDGTVTIFQLIKTYGENEAAYIRDISKPVSGSVLVAVDGVAQIQGQNFSVDPQIGEINFLQGHIPPVGALVTAGFEFDVPVRFSSDQMTINIAAFTAGDVPSIQLLELLQ